MRGNAGDRSGDADARTLRAHVCGRLRRMPLHPTPSGTRAAFLSLLALLCGIIYHVCPQSMHLVLSRSPLSYIYEIYIYIYIYMTLSALPCCVGVDPCHTTLPHVVLALSSCSSLPCCGVCCRVCCRVCCKICCISCCRALQQSILVENDARKIHVLQKHVYLSGSLHEATRWRAAECDAWGSALFYVHLRACGGV